MHTAAVLAFVLPTLFCAAYWLGARVEREQHSMDDQAALRRAHQAGRDEVVDAMREVMRREHFIWHEAPVTAHSHLSRELAKFLPDPFTYDEEAHHG